MLIFILGGFCVERKNSNALGGNIIFKEKSIKHWNKTPIKVLFLILLSILCGIIGGIIFSRFNESYKSKMSDHLYKYDINVINVINRVNCSIVGVSAYLKDGSVNDGKFIQNNLTGVIYSEDGYIVTSFEGVKNADKIYIKFPSTLDIVKEAKLVGYNEEYDICVLKISGRGYINGDFKEDISGVSHGLKVISLGNQYGKSNTYTVYSGIVNGISLNGDKVYIKSDFGINELNFGGPICDVEGQILGIGSLKLNREMIKQGHGSIYISSQDVLNIVCEIIESATLI